MFSNATKVQIAGLPMVHGLRAKTKRQTKRTLETFLRDGLELDPDVQYQTSGCTVHRLSQRPPKKSWQNEDPTNYIQGLDGFR